MDHQKKSNVSNLIFLCNLLMFFSVVCYPSMLEAGGGSSE